MSVKTDQVVIVGAGISGLYLAWQLKKQRVPYTILEARSRAGGRIISPDGYDLGPAWFWPGQPRILRLLQDLNLRYYPQQDEGSGLYQSQHGTQSLPSGYTGAAYRVEHGLSSVINQLIDEIGEENIVFNQAVEVVKAEFDLTQRQKVKVVTGSQEYLASQVAMALPPRLIAQHIRFESNLPAGLLNEFSATPTWMASHAKALIRYRAPFWRDHGLSGTVLSAVGPLAQIHDASLPGQGQEHALFGFYAWSAEQRRQKASCCHEELLSQLASLFGEQAMDPLSINTMDWSNEIYTASEDDKQPLNYHPVYGLSQTAVWNDSLHFCATEAAPVYGGFIEGALEAADNSLSRIMAKAA